MIYSAILISYIAGGSGAVILQASAAGSIARYIDYPPIIVHCILLGCGRKIAAGRQMEHLGFGITDEILC